MHTGEAFKWHVPVCFAWPADGRNRLPSPHSQKQFAKIYGLTQGVNAKYHAIYGFYSVNSMVNCFFSVHCL
jgi:hypothetical protein